MGAAMVTRLLRAGHDVTVHNRTRSKAEALVEHGATVADSIAELADRDVVFTVVASSDDLVSVLTGPDGLLSRDDAAPGIVVDSSTVSLDASAEVRAACEGRGVRYLAAPVSGNPKVIAAGRLNFAVSGAAEDFETVHPLFEAMGEAAFHVGEGEVARLVKLAHNLYLATVIQSLVEVTLLAERGGASREAFLGFLNASPMGSMFSRYKAPALVNLDFHPTFTMELLHKDLNLGLAEARSRAVPMPVTTTVQQIVQSAIGNGYVDEDFAALILHHAAAAGMQVDSEHAEVDDGLAPDQ